MRRDLTGIAVASLLTTGCVILLLLSGAAATGTVAAALRVTGGLPLVLILPGYALGALLLPGRMRPAHINAALWRGMWIAGLSLATAVLGGLVLNLTPAGLSRAGWTITLAGITLAALAAAAALRMREAHRGHPEDAPASPGKPQQPEPAPVRARLSLRTPATAYSAGAVLLIVVAVWLGVFSAARQQPAGFAQLWLVPAGNGPARATIGVRNHYARAESFHLVLRRGSKVAAAWDLDLATGKSWSATVPAPAGQRLSASLTAPGEIGPSQVVTLHQGASERTPSHRTGGQRPRGQR